MILLTLETKEAQFLRGVILRGMVDIASRMQDVQFAKNLVIIDDKIVAAMQNESRENAKVVTLNIPQEGTTGHGGSTSG